MKERTQYQIQEIRRQAEEWIAYGFKVSFIDNLGVYITFKKTYSPLKFDAIKWDGTKETWGLGKFTNTMNVWLQNPTTNLEIERRS